MVRGGKYGEMYALNLYYSMHGLSDEGSYYFTSNPTPGTGIIIPMIAAFDATKPALVIQNQDNLGGKRTYIDYLKLILTVVGGGSPTDLKYAIYMDNINRYTSGGSQLSVVNANMDAGGNPISKVWFGAITAPAASAAVRLISSGTIRTIASVVNDTDIWTFSSIEKNSAGTSLALATAGVFNSPVPPAILGPGANHSLLLYLWSTGETTTGKTYTIDLGFWER
jgi:hypothetical protein